MPFRLVICYARMQSSATTFLKCSDQNRQVFTRKFRLAVPFATDKPGTTSTIHPLQSTAQLYSTFDSVNCGLNLASVLIEYPGSGQSCGPPSVETILDSAVQVRIAMLVKSLPRLSMN